MRTDFGKLLDDMVEGYTPSPSPQQEMEAKVSDMEKRLSDMIETKLSNINISQTTPQSNDTQEQVHTDTEDVPQEDASNTSNSENKGE